MDKQQALDLLRKASKSSHMITTYVFGDDGPIVSQPMSAGQMRVTRVVVETYDTGYQTIDAKGYSVTKDGRKKSGAYFFAPHEIDEIFKEALLDL